MSSLGRGSSDSTGYGDWKAKVDREDIRMKLDDIERKIDHNRMEGR